MTEYGWSLRRLILKINIALTLGRAPHILFYVFKTERKCVLVPYLLVSCTLSKSETDTSLGDKAQLSKIIKNRKTTYICISSRFLLSDNMDKNRFPHNKISLQASVYCLLLICIYWPFHVFRKTNLCSIYYN